MTKRVFLLLLKIFALGGLFVPLVFAADSAKIISRANDLYQKGKYKEALKLYEDALAAKPDMPLLNFNAGAARFKTGEYEKAAGSFEKGLVSEAKNLESASSYNLANTKYSIAKSREGSDPSSAVKLLDESLGYYKRAIELNPRDNDAKFNYELVNRELKALKEKLKQQQQQQGQGGQQQQNQQSQQDKEQQNKQQQGQGQEEKKEQEQKQESQQQQEQQPQPAENQPQDLKEMSPEEAKMLLEGYRQEEAGQGKLEDTRKGQPTEAAKDW